jgi:hypothetical protein
MNIEYKAVTFVENNDILHGHYFYNITLPNALQKMKEKGIDPIKKTNMGISVYPW